MKIADVLQVSGECVRLVIFVAGVLCAEPVLCVTDVSACVFIVAEYFLDDASYTIHQGSQ